MSTPIKPESEVPSTDGAVAPAESGGARFPCRQCGAKLEYEPGTTALKCPYCGAENEIAKAAATVEELDFAAELKELEAGAGTQETLTVKCQACAAEVTAPPDVTAFSCPFCGTNIVATARSSKAIKPRSLLPFSVKREKAQELFRGWVRKLWFAPSAVKKLAAIDQKLAGLYMPAWTYDCRTRAAYTGQRGDYYWVTETYTAMVNGKPQVRTRQVRKIRWSSASGVVANTFDDLLVLASRSLPEKLATSLAPWDLEDLVPYQDDYLSGFTAESYQVGLADGFEAAKGLMDPVIRSTVCRDIGGDEQRIASLAVQYGSITFKHLLLPVWVSAYRFKERVYRFLVNARTGEVQGDRPYSWVKITLAVLGGLALAGVIVMIVAAANR
jgi:predicted RNA-binding Zn-ribbon protein involved in translation (DUF1610 family)